jgi:type I restriction enzyme R subunit
MPQLLIVTEKLLTGFDAPLLYCMYLDKPMRDHVLLQAIARVNRPYEDEGGKAKPGGFVLDFVGIFENLEKALAFDSRDVESVVEGLDVLKERYAELMDRARTRYLPLGQGLVADKAAEEVLRAFLDEEGRHELYRFFLELEDLYEIISPDVFLRPYLEDYQRVADIYALVRSAYEGGTPDLRDLARKTARLVQEHTRSGVISEALGVYEITPQTLDQIALANQPDTVNVFNLLKSIEQEVASKAALAPYLISIGDRAEEIAERFKGRQVSTEEALRALEELVREINQARQEQAERDVSLEAFAVLWLLKRRGVERASEAAEEMEAAFREHPHWRTSEAEQRSVRRALYTALDKLALNDVPVIAEQIIGVLRREA